MLRWEVIAKTMDNPNFENKKKIQCEHVPHDFRLVRHCGCERILVDVETWQRGGESGHASVSEVLGPAFKCWGHAATRRTLRVE